MDSDYRYKNNLKNSQDKNTKRELLNLLENDDEVSVMIFKLFERFRKKGISKVDITRYTNEIDELKLENDKISSKVKELENLVSNQEREKDNLESEITNNKNKINSQQIETKKDKETISTLKNENVRLENIETKYNHLVGKFETLINTYKVYLSLKNEHSTFLQSLFKGDSIDLFFTCGVQDENIHSLWDYIKNSIIEEKNSIDELKQIFFYFFDLYNKMYSSPLYKLSDVAVSDRFEAEKHIKANQHNYSGNVTKIIFEGYYNCNTDEVIKKTVVEIN